MYRRHNSLTTSIHQPFSSKQSSYYAKAKNLKTSIRPSMTITTQQCQACKHQSQNYFKMEKKTKDKNLNVIKNQYYGDQRQSKQEIKNLHLSKKYLEQLLEQTKKQHQNQMISYNNKISQLNQALQTKQQQIFKLQRLSSQSHYQPQNQPHPTHPTHPTHPILSTSIVKSYNNLNDKSFYQDELDKKQRRIKELNLQIFAIQEDRKKLSENLKTRDQRIQELEEKLDSLKVVKEQYHSMSVLIKKMESDKKQLVNHYENKVQQICENYQKEILNHETNYLQLQQILKDQSRQKQYLTKTTTNFRSQQQKIMHLFNQHTSQSDQTFSKLSCIEQQLSFIKKKFAHLLKISQENFSNSQEQKCIQRIHRYQAESLSNVNLSPIKKEKKFY